MVCIGSSQRFISLAGILDSTLNYIRNSVGTQVPVCNDQILITVTSREST